VLAFFPSLKLHVKHRHRKREGKKANTNE